LALFWNPPGSPRRVTLGRQIAPGSAAVGLLDGVLAELIGPQWSAGLFGGSQPEPVTLGFSADILQLGGYVRRRSRPGGSQQWSTTLGVSGSYQAAPREPGVRIPAGDLYEPALQHVRLAGGRLLPPVEADTGNGRDLAHEHVRHGALPCERAA